MIGKNINANGLRVRLVRINKTKIMIDKKQLIEELLECVNDATDTQTAMTGMTMCAILMNEVIDQSLILPVVSQQRELLLAYEDYLNEYHTKEDRIKQVDKYLKANNCG